MNIIRHIARLRAECDRIQKEGHLKGLPDGYAAISNIEIEIQNLQDAADQKINDKKKDRGQ